MKKTSMWAVLILTICFAASAGVAQQKVPPPPRPSDDPSISNSAGTQAAPQNAKPARIAVVDLKKLAREIAAGKPGPAGADLQKSLDRAREYSKQRGVGFLFDTSTENSPIVYGDKKIDITEDILHPSNQYSGAGSVKVAVINVRTAIVNCAEGRQAAIQLQAQFAPKQAELDSLYKQVGDSPAFRLKQQQVGADSAAAQTEIINRIGQKMVALLNKYAAEQNIGLIFDTSSNNAQLWYASGGLDVTNTVVGLYDRAYAAVANTSPAPVLSNSAVTRDVKIAVIDIKTAIGNTAEGKQAVAEIQSDFASDLAELDGLRRQGVDSQALQLKQKQVDGETDPVRQGSIDRIGANIIEIVNKDAESAGDGLVIDATSPVLVWSTGDTITQNVIQEYDRTHQPLEGPSLHATLKFIREQVNGTKANYIAYLHDNVAGNDWANKFVTELAMRDSESCYIVSHLKEWRDGSVVTDADNVLYLKQVANVIVMPKDQDLMAQAAAGGHPEWSAKVEPPVFVLKLRLTTRDEFRFDLLDEDMTNRVAKALIHAVEICGGGSKSPF